VKYQIRILMFFQKKVEEFEKTLVLENLIDGLVDKSAQTSTDPHEPVPLCSNLANVESSKKMTQKQKKKKKRRRKK